MDEIIKMLEEILYGKDNEEILDNIFENPLQQLDNIIDSIGF